jgi:hypothetical protein
LPPGGATPCDPVADLLVGMIVEDEQRHDALLLAIIRR